MKRQLFIFFCVVVCSLICYFYCSFKSDFQDSVIRKQVDQKNSRMKRIFDAVVKMMQMLKSVLHLKFIKTAANDFIKMNKNFFDGKVFHFDAENAQNYRRVLRGRKCQFEYVQSGVIQYIRASEIMTYRNIYITDNAKIKPKALKQINANVVRALRLYGIASYKKPVIVITSLQELKAYGLYDAVTNTVYFSDMIVNPEFMKTAGGTGITERHEIWHLKQADDFRNAVGKITRENFAAYLNWIKPRSKKRIDMRGITSENVGDISSLAAFMYSIGRFDEVEAELMAKEEL